MKIMSSTGNKLIDSKECQACQAKQLTARNARHENNYIVVNEQYILPLIITICAVLYI